MEQDRETLYLHTSSFWYQRFLFIQIRNCQDIEGILIKDAEVKTSAYADGSYFFFRDTISTNHVLYLHERFKTHFSLKINLSLRPVGWEHQDIVETKLSTVIGLI